MFPSAIEEFPVSHYQCPFGLLYETMRVFSEQQKFIFHNFIVWEFQDQSPDRFYTELSSWSRRIHSQFSVCPHTVESGRHRSESLLLRTKSEWECHLHEVIASQRPIQWKSENIRDYISAYRYGILVPNIKSVIICVSASFGDQGLELIILVRFQLYLIVVLICSSLMTNDLHHLSIFLFTSDCVLEGQLYPWSRPNFLSCVLWGAHYFILWQWPRFAQQVKFPRTLNLCPLVL